MSPALQKLIQSAKSNFDLSRPEDQDSLYELTESLLALAEPPAIDDLRAAARHTDAPLEFRIAAKLYESRVKILKIKKPICVAVLFAMWGEQNRLRPQSADNPNGEDSLRNKVRQLEWIVADTPITWTLYAIDDGCPHDSGGLAASIAATLPQANQIRVLYLAKELPSDQPALRELKSADDSRKGGAILFGAQSALDDGADAIVYTDADNSVHLGQLGILLAPYAAGAPVVLGNRKDADSVLVKQEARWGIGIKLLRHMQRMVGSEIFAKHQILDTQAAFKLYDREVVAQILARPSVFDFSFDSDWILATIAMGIEFEKVPFAFVDSFAESASIVQGPMTTWETLLLGLVKAVRARGIDHNTEMAAVLEDEIKSHADLELLIDHLPPQLEPAAEKELGDPAILSPGEIREWIRLRKHRAGG